MKERQIPNIHDCIDRRLKKGTSTDGNTVVNIFPNHPCFSNSIKQSANIFTGNKTRVQYIEPIRNIEKLNMANWKR